MLEGMIRMMDYETDGTLKGTDYTRPSLSGFPGPINLGNPEEVSIRSLAEKVIGLARSQAEIVFKKLPEDDPRRRCPDISKARNSLKWEPQVPLEEGLKKTIDYFKNPSRDSQNLL